MPGSHNPQETKTERQARERREADKAASGSPGPGTIPSPKKKKIRGSLRINIRYYLSSILTWLSRIFYAGLICYGLFLFYTDFTVWTEQEIKRVFSQGYDQRLHNR